MKREYNYKPKHERILSKTLTKVRKIVGRPRRTVDLETFQDIEVESA